MPTLTRVLIILCIGVAAILAWRSYGDAARAMIANSSPQLGWLAPQAALLAHNAPDMIGLAAQAASSPDQPRLNAMSLDLEATRQNVDRIAITQEQITRNVGQLAAAQERMTRNVDQLTAGQQRITREIAKLQAFKQQIKPTPWPAPARNPVSRSLPALTVR